jgi:hypothetical protein
VYGLQALIALRVLRHEHSCTLPIELYYSGEEELDPVSLQVRAWVLVCVP